jgi:glycosyltransferase involved in cell wall biosynthesis
MNAKPVISVIVPIYNSGQYLEKTIISILNQTYKDLELILVDDGSTDNSGEICSEFQKNDNRIKILTQKNSGVSEARNKGIVESTGKYICFVDSDDWIDETYLDDFGISEDNYDGTLFIQGFNDCYDGKTYRNIKNSYKHNLYKPAIKEEIEGFELFHNGYICSKLYQRSILVENNIKFEKSLHMNEDHIFNFDYFRYIKFINVTSHSGYNYEHRNNNSLSRRRYPYDQRELILKFFYEKSSILLLQYSIGKKYSKKICLFSKKLLLEAIYAMYRPYSFLIKKDRIANLHLLINDYGPLFILDKHIICFNYILNSKSPVFIDFNYSIFFKIRYFITGLAKKNLKIQ